MILVICTHLFALFLPLRYAFALFVSPLFSLPARIFRAVGSPSIDYCCCWGSIVCCSWQVYTARLRFPCHAGQVLRAKLPPTAEHFFFACLCPYALANRLPCEPKGIQISCCHCCRRRALEVFVVIVVFRYRPVLLPYSPNSRTLSSRLVPSSLVAAFLQP